MWWSKYSTPRLTARRIPVCVCAMFERLTEFCFAFRFVFFCASLLHFTSQMDRLHVCYYCADVWSVLAYFCSEYSRSCPSTGRSGQIIDSVCMSHFSWREWPIRCSCSTMGVAAPARLKLVACCVHSSHNAGDRRTKVGRKISRLTQNVWFVNVFSTFRCQNSVVKIWQLVYIASMLTKIMCRITCLVNVELKSSYHCTCTIALTRIFSKTSVYTRTNS